ncbi:MAG: amidase [Alphaproteobacteria bacterium]|nr:amidase [Alphaproteobacteria bacterium]
MTEHNIDTSSIESLAGAMRDGEVSASDLAEWSIANREQRGETLHAYKTWAPDRFRAEAAAADAVLAAGIDLGPLQGIPVAVKDLYGVAGYPTFAGCPRELPDKWRSEGPVVRALRHQLATVSGKTHTVQFAFGALGTNVHWGTPRNPWDGENHRVPGGSSAGAGVSLWEGSALLALGSDTAGSVRMPASFTGTVGVKTSKGRWSTAGIVPLSTTLDTAGTLTRTVTDAVLAFAVIDPQVSEPAHAFSHRLGTASPADFHIGVCDWYFADCDPGVAEGVKAALDELAAAGARISSVEVPELEDSIAMFKRGGLAAPEFASFINNEMTAFRDDLDPNVAARFEAMESVEAGEYMARCSQRLDLVRRVRDSMAGFDAIVGPTIAITPPTVDEVADPRSYHRANMGASRNTSTVNMLDLCAVTMPVALDAAGMPVGLHIICPLGEDETALAIALAFEKVLGTARQRLGVPPLCA